MSKEKMRAYPLSDMLPGERFYFCRDRKKTIWQLNDVMPFEVKTQKGFKIKYANCRQGTESTFTNKQFKTHNAWVIFLRDVNE
jgi:hypothetical protein